LSGKEIAFSLETHIAFAIIFCRLKYSRSPKKLSKTFEGMAKLWKSI